MMNESKCSAGLWLISDYDDGDDDGGDNDDDGDDDQTVANL